MADPRPLHFAQVDIYTTGALDSEVLVLARPCGEKSTGFYLTPAEAKKLGRSLIQRAARAIAVQRENHNATRNS